MTSEVERCQIPCVPIFKNDTNPDAVTYCTKEDLRQCYKERDKEITFYDAVDWKRKLSPNIESFMTTFAERLTRNQLLMQKIQDAYTYAPFPAESSWNSLTEEEKKKYKFDKGRPKRFANLLIEVVKNEDYTNCNNLIINFVLYRGAVAGRQRQVLFHISLHSIKPIFYRDKVRSRSGCGYYARPDTCKVEEGTETHPTDSGPFHYTINTLYWGDKTRCGDREDLPHLEFVADVNKPGKFKRTLKGDIVTPIRHAKIVLSKNAMESLDPEISRAKALLKKNYNERMSQKLSASTENIARAFLSENDVNLRNQARILEEEIRSRFTKEQEPLIKSILIDIHLEIYFAFIDFWNNELFPSIRRKNESGGGTRKQKRRMKTTRRLVAHKHK